MPDNSLDLDQPRWGADQIGRDLGLITVGPEDKDYDKQLRRTFYMLEKGYANASKVGRAWVSTPRRLRRLFTGNQD
jgi:hypothetical protein